MYSVSRKGLRCQICTGCGLCPGVTAENVSSGGQRSEIMPENGEPGVPGAKCESADPGGRCTGVTREDGRPGRLQVLTADALRGERIPFAGNGRRLAVADIGTTTIAMLLYAADGSVEERFVEVNPQTAYGADVLSRIKAAEKPSAAVLMQEMVRHVLEKGLRKFKRRLSAGEELYLVTAANTTMTYLLMGWDTAELGHAPFQASRLSGAETDLSGIHCFVLPGFSAFVGGDILAGCCACSMTDREEITLLIDLGTNGELLLGNCHRRIACATAAGPAFEGGVNRGIWGADMIRLLAILRRDGLLDETGLLAEPYFDRGIRIGNVCVTQEAVRSVQLAKEAIAAGIDVLLKKYGIPGGAVDRVVLAGGFGYYLDPADAAEIGLLPRIFADRTVSGGNTALSGAACAGREVISSGWESAWSRLEGYRKGTEIVNLAMTPGFDELYIQRMEFK